LVAARVPIDAAISGAAAMNKTKIVVLIPCYNEAAAIAQVVKQFRAALPHAEIHVFDNNSSDDTIEIARRAGARVSSVGAQGKGNVVRRMFADVEADVYLLVDGDNTYDARAARHMVNTLVRNKLDMVVGTRVSTEQAAYRTGHRFGNRLLTGCVAAIFGRSFTDMLSGYRVFSRRYVKSFPAHSGGFETETELTVHALELRMPTKEIPTRYGARPKGSSSKLNTYRDGFRILMMIVRLFRIEKPLAFFSAGAATAAVTSILLATPIFLNYLATGLVPRFPTAILCASLMLMAIILLTCGVILDFVAHVRREQKRFAYLATPAPKNDHIQEDMAPAYDFRSTDPGLPPQAKALEQEAG
jgi:glycosyltransferase involved in cell wall biosynthesis